MTDPVHSSFEQPIALVVDDDQMMRLLFRRAMEQAGYQVREASDGAEALARLAEFIPTVVLMDVLMPGTDGLTACAQLRQLPNGADVPVILVTGVDDNESIEKAYQAGATDFVLKPINWALFRHRISFVMRAQRIFMESRRQEARLRQGQRIARLGYWEWGWPDDIVEASPEFYALLGINVTHPPSSAQELFDAVDEANRQHVRSVFTETMARRVPYSVELKLASLRGQDRYLLAEGEFQFDPAKNGCIMRGVLQDVSEQRRAQDRIRMLVLYDQLTGLANRDLFIEHLQISLKSAQRNQHGMGLLYIRVSRMARLHDALGPVGGDAAVQQVAQILTRAVREKDLYPKEFVHEEHVEVGRLGDHEFAVLLHAIPLENTLQRIAQRLLERFAVPFRQGQIECYLGVHIGLARFPQDGLDADSLLRHSRLAANTSDRSEYSHYDKQRHDEAVDNLRLEAELSRAVRQGEVDVVFQPMLDLGTQRVVGIEALARWNHPQLGDIPPTRFIPIAEESGLILPLGDHIFRRAVEAAVAWAKQGIRPLWLSINASPAQIAHRDLLPMLQSVIEETACNPEYLILEITEGLLLSSAQNVVAKLKAIKDLGFSIAIDDFGTGFSSMGYFKHLPIDELKIDCSFIRDMQKSPADLAIVRSIISLSKNLGFRVVAEGVETEEQLKVLVDEGCDWVQGFFVGAPGTASDITPQLPQPIPASVANG